MMKPNMFTLGAALASGYAVYLAFAGSSQLLVGFLIGAGVAIGLTLHPRLALRGVGVAAALGLLGVALGLPFVAALMIILVAPFLLVVR